MVTQEKPRVILPILISKVPIGKAVEPAPSLTLSGLFIVTMVVQHLRQTCTSPYHHR